MNFFKNFSRNIIINFKNMPLASIFSYLATIYLLLIISSKDLLKNDYSLKLLIFFISAYFLTSSLYFFKNRILPFIGTLILAIIFWFYGSSIEKEYFIIWAVFINITSISISFWAPFYNKESSNLEVFNQIKAILGSLIFSFMLSVLIIVGVYIAFGAFSKLFNININDKIFGYTATLIFGVFGANYYMNLLQNIELNQTFNKVEELFAKYILPIFTIGYFIILYAYTIKIVINNSWPKGYLAWFILFFSLVAALSYLYLTPYKNRFKKFILIAIIPQAIMLILAVYKRVQQYSFTEARYMLIIYALFLIVAALYLLIKNRYKTVLIAASVILFLTQVGPFSALNISKKAQYKIYLDNLQNYKNGDKTLNTKYKLSAAIEYLASRWGIAAFKDSIDNIVNDYKMNKSGSHRNIKYFVTKKLGFEYVSYYDYQRGKEPTKRDLLYLNQDFNYINIKGYDYFVKIDGILNYMDIEKKINSINTKIIFKKDKIVIENRDKKSVINLKTYIAKLYNNGNKDLLNYLYEDKSFKFKLIIEYISVKKDQIVEIRSFLFYKNLSD